MHEFTTVTVGAAATGEFQDLPLKSAPLPPADSLVGDKGRIRLLHREGLKYRSSSSSTPLEGALDEHQRGACAAPQEEIWRGLQ
jgi:hypothetical protein